MLTLEEATWNLDGALTSEKIPLYRRKRIRAAVCNVALAAAKLGYQQGAVEAVGEMTRRTSSVLDASAEVNRLLGPEKAGG